jgi:hypothetical protein
MRYNLAIVLFLLLFTVTYSLPWSPTSDSWVVDTTEVMQSKTCYQYNTISLVYNKANYESNQMCWVRFNYTDPVVPTNSKLSNWSMMFEPRTGIFSVDVVGNLIGTTNQHHFMMPFAYDSKNTWDGAAPFNSLCPNGDMIVYYVGQTGKLSGTVNMRYLSENINDIQLINIRKALAIAASSVNLKMQSVVPASQDILMDLKNKMLPGDVGLSYTCFNTSSMTHYEVFPFTINNQNFSASSRFINITVQVVCEGVPSTSWSTSTIESAVQPAYIVPLTSNYNTFKAVIIEVPESTCIVKKQEDNVLAQTFQMGIAFLKAWNSYVEQVIPAPIFRIIKGISEFVNLLIAFIALVIIFQTTKYLLAFRQAIKSSLTKSSIIFAQLIFWLIVLIMFFWVISHIWSFCLIKSYTILYGLKTIGIELKAPSGALDVGAYSWDLLIIGSVGTLTSDCASCWEQYSPVEAVAKEKLYQEFIPMSCQEGDVGCPSIIIRTTMIGIVIYIIIVILTILWETTSYIRRKVKGMEVEIRKPDVDDSNYDGEEYDERR